MAEIVQLDELTINQIAAGEVIERPASVVKELVENSIDAGAKNITVEIKNGGITEIKIIDDGKGIAKDDMQIAFERHATSKIRSAQDLAKVTTMGFRGEALASVASVARVEMISKTKTDDGNRIIMEAGEELLFEKAGTSNGTTICVSNLFFNTPVRYKFLKKDYTEAGYIEDALKRIALLHSDISFTFKSNNKLILKTNGKGNIKETIYSIFGKEISENILNVSYELEGIKVEGVVGNAIIARSNRKNQMFFVNTRYIQDRGITATMDKAYKGMIPIGRFPFAILNIVINPEEVDVNVHPSKIEVRFENENKVLRAIYYGVKDALSKIELVENVTKEKFDANKQFKNNYLELLNKNQEQKNNIIQNKISEDTEKYIPNNTENSMEHLILNYENNNTKGLDLTSELKENLSEEENEILTLIKDVEKRDNNILENLDEEEQKIHIQKSITEEILKNEEDNSLKNILIKNKNEEAEEKIIESKAEKDELSTTNNNYKNILETEINNSQKVNFDEMYQKAFGINLLEKRKEEDKLNFSNVKNANESIFKNSDLSYKVIGVAFKTYIIIEMQKEIYLIDQHAAHERLLYEKVKKRYYENTDKEVQRLLFPDVITLSYREIQMIKNNKDIFTRAGFEFEEFGINTIRLIGVPAMFDVLNTKQLFLDILDELETKQFSGREQIEDRFIATIACKAAVKAGDLLDNREIDNLLKELLKLNNPFTCPHGRPTAIKMSQSDLEKKFARKQ